MLECVWKVLAGRAGGWLEEYYDRHGLAIYSAAEEVIQTWSQAQRAFTDSISSVLDEEGRNTPGYDYEFHRGRKISRS